MILELIAYYRQVEMDLQERQINQRREWQRHDDVDRLESALRSAKLRLRLAVAH